MTEGILQFTPETDITITGRDGDPQVDALHREDLAPVLDIEHDDGTVTSCELDVERLVDVMLLYSSMETLEYDWRNPGL